MSDFDAIAAAIAARYAPANIAAPAGLVNVRSSTSDLPNALGKMPVVLVFPDTGDLSTGNGTRLGTSTWLVRFYFGLTRNLARETNALRRWLTVLVDQHRTGMQLGGLVTAVRTRGWRIGILDYAGRSYSGIELRIEVVTSEPWAPTS